MATDPATGLPPSLSSLLDAAVSDAKRRGHDRVTPAHLAPVLLVNGPDAIAAELPASSVTRIEAYLSTLPRTFDTPVPEDRTLVMLRGCANRADPVMALAEALRILAGDLSGEVLAPADPVSPGAEPTDGPDAVAPAGDDQRSTATSPRTAFALPDRLKGIAEVVDPSPPVVSRTDAVRRLLSLLTAREPQTPLLVAPQGHGRTGMSRCLAAALADPSYTGPLAGRPVVRTRAEGVITTGRSDALLRVMEACRGNAVLFVDDVEVLCALGGSGADVSSVAVLRGALHDPDLRIVLTVAAEYADRLQAVDRELFDEIDRVDLPPLTETEVLDVARAAATALSAYHGVGISDEVIAASVSPPRQIDATGHPALAVSRLDRAAAAAALGPDRAATAADLGTAVSGQQYLSFDPDAASERLRQSVLGQDAAIDAVANRLAVTRASLDLRPERPDGVFLLAGPTGTGKTELALSLATEVFGTAEAIVRLDMSEFADEMSISKLIGSAPGYVGSTEPESWLTTRIRRRPQSVLLLDEIEKAHPMVWNTFLQVFDAGRLSDSQGRVADFRDVIVVMTTNIGASAFEQRSAAGFMPAEATADQDAARVMAELKHRMRPELLNRLDEILVFRPLSPETVRAIVRKNLDRVTARLADRGWVVTIGPGVEDWLVTNGYSREYGARPLLRLLESRLLNRIARLPHGSVTVSVTADDLAATPV